METPYEAILGSLSCAVGDILDNELTDENEADLQEIVMATFHGLVRYLPDTDDDLKRIKADLIAYFDDDDDDDDNGSDDGDCDGGDGIKYVPAMDVRLGTLLRLRHASR